MNKTIFFVGDSINGQVYQAALCEIPRWGLMMARSHGPGEPLIRDAELTARRDAYWRHHARYSHIHADSGRHFWLGDEPAELEIVAETGTFVVPKGWHKYQRSDLAGTLSMADVVVVNYGLHYHDPPGQKGGKMAVYEAEMRALFRQLDAFAQQPGKAAVFRETSAQHFVGTGSYAGDEQAHPRVGSPCKCAAMSEAVLWSNEVVRMNQVIARLAAEFPHVRVLPFYNVTWPRHDMHEEQFCGFQQMRDDATSTGSCCDCTHLCVTPQLWRHVFHSLWSVLATTRATEALPNRVRG